jgi:hypothetical protein
MHKNIPYLHIDVKSYEVQGPMNVVDKEKVAWEQKLFLELMEYWMNPYEPRNKQMGRRICRGPKGVGCGRMGGYNLELREIKKDGSVSAPYYNPRPI